MKLTIRESILFITGIAGYLDYSDAGRLFASVSNRNRVIKQMKDADLIRTSFFKGMYYIKLTAKGREEFISSYPEYILYENYSGDMVGKKRRLMIGHAMTTMLLLGIDIEHTNRKGFYFCPGKELIRKEIELLAVPDTDLSHLDKLYPRSRTVGFLSTDSGDYNVYQTGEGNIKWFEKSENSELMAHKNARRTENLDVGMLILADAPSVVESIFEMTRIKDGTGKFLAEKNEMRMPLPSFYSDIYLICPMDYSFTDGNGETINVKVDQDYARVELQLLHDRMMGETIRDVLESGTWGGSEFINALIPLDLRELYGMYGEENRSSRTVYVTEPYYPYINFLLPKCDVRAVSLFEIGRILDENKK